MALQAYGGLAEVAVRCLCELLVALPHFNFHNNIVVVLAPLMNDSTKKVSLMGAAAQPSPALCDAFTCSLCFRCPACAVTRSGSSSSRTERAGPRWPRCELSPAS